MTDRQVGWLVTLGGALAGLAASRLAAKAGALGGVPANWWIPAPPRPKLCYPTKRKALMEIVDANRALIEQYKGLSNREGAAEFDALNHKYGLKGKHAVHSIGEALWVAMPVGRPYCLDQFDLDALNDTSPVREAGTPFVLPDHAYALAWQRDAAKYYRDAEG